MASISASVLSTQTRQSIVKNAFARAVCCKQGTRSIIARSIRLVILLLDFDRLSLSLFLSLSLLGAIHPLDLRFALLAFLARLLIVTRWQSVIVQFVLLSGRFSTKTNATLSTRKELD
jgi:hypothetical protein